MTTNLNASNREALLLPDQITPYDNLDILPPPDAAWLLSQMDNASSTPMGRKGRVNTRDINLQEDFNNSQFLQSSANKDDAGAYALMDDLELDIDFGDLDEQPRGVDNDMSMEVGRDAAAAPAEDDIFSELEIAARNAKDQGDREPSLNLDFEDGVRIADDEGDIHMGDDLQFNLNDQSAMPGAADINRARISESPLSDIDEDLAREVEEEVTRHQQEDLYEPAAGDDTTIVRRPAQRARRQKIITPDEQTMLSSTYIKEQHANRENILKTQSFLPKDPYALALIEMHKSGGFVTNIILGGRGSAWAPELQPMLSLTGSKQANELKRKRDSGIADMESDHGAWKSPRIDVGDEDEFVLGGDDNAVNHSIGPDGTILEIPADETAHEREGSPMPAWDETAMPLVHPADSGPVSLGTKHAVHVLRDIFGDEAATSAEKRKQNAVVFQELLPEKKTTKADATKMFFECLVLATKDAIKVDQGEELGAPIKVRGKRGLWGEWAEREAGGEIAEDEEVQGGPVAPAAAPAIAVES